MAPNLLSVIKILTHLKGIRLRNKGITRKQKQQKMEMAAAQNQNIEIIQFQRLPSRHRSAKNQRHPSPTIHETNIDAGSVPTCY
ncbi:uncharacterized protein LOC120334062 isoform X3 [Styela clava]